MGYVKKIVLLLVCAWATGLPLAVDDLAHNNREIFYVNPVAGEIRMKARKNTVKQAFLFKDSAAVRMDNVFQDEYFDYFTTDIGRFDTTLNYYFIARDGVDSVILPPGNRFKPRVPMFQPPAWAAGKIYYRIFVDGFTNGDPANDPAGVRAWGSKPQGWDPYGGDLTGIEQQLSYVDSLNADVLLLSPVWSANSNHKFNFMDFGSIDPAFGDTSQLRALVNEVHRRNKKIVLTFIATHTGKDFPAFSDVLNTQDNSKYLNWYLIKNRPIKTTPDYYECWRNDPVFPKLNLKEPQVRNYLMGYVEYWRKFGVDGFYIGEDPEISVDFLKELRAFIKVKYPNLLIIGCDSRPNTGDGFDGSLDPRFSELVFNYFGKKTITASEFDRALRRILFWNASQTNAVNLMSPSTYEYRIGKYANPVDLRNMYAFLFTCCGSPVITYGDEIGLSESEPLNLGSFRYEVGYRDLGLLAEIRRLAAIRKANPQIAGKYFYTLLANDITQVYAYDRGGLITAINSGESPAFVMLPAWDGSYTDLVNGETVTVTQQQLRISIAPKSYRIFRREL